MGFSSRGLPIYTVCPASYIESAIGSLVPEKGARQVEKIEERTEDCEIIESKEREGHEGEQLEEDTNRQTSAHLHQPILPVS